MNETMMNSDKNNVRAIADLASSNLTMGWLFISCIRVARLWSSCNDPTPCFAKWLCATPILSPTEWFMQ
ncbi:MAG: hypothetical protein ACLPZY_15275 [Terracidiphilus sp.]